MKKVLLILMLGVFTFGSSGFVSLQGTQDCDDYALGVFEQDLLYPGAYSLQDSYDLYMFAYETCILNGGSSDYEVTVVLN